VDPDKKQKAFEAHAHGKEVLPQLQKHIPKMLPESEDDRIGEELAKLEVEHKKEHHHQHAHQHAANHAAAVH